MLNINGLSQGVSPDKLFKNFDRYTYNSPVANRKNDSFEMNKSSNNVIAFRQRGKEMLVVSFTGLKDPYESQKPAIQMKVRGVQNYQDPPDIKSRYKKSINRLADSNWYDGKKLDYEIIIQSNEIDLHDPDFGKIGRVPDQLASGLISLIRKNPKNYRFELSNVIAGTTKGAETIGLRVNLLYQGNNKKEESLARNTFNEFLNSKDCADKVMLYQPKISPEDTLKIILDYETQIKGVESAKAMKKVIKNIVNEIAYSERILLLGHCKPDGDTIGSVLGLKNAIRLMDPTKKIDCAIDDKIPGLFRHKLPGIDDEIKYPYNPERIENIKKEIEDLKKEPESNKTTEKIQALSQELERMQNPENLLDKDAKYDLVVLMDIPTPQRFTDKFKQYIENAEKVIYVDHHPNRLNEWENAAAQTGVNMQKIKDDKLAWIADAVPSTTQLVAIIAARMLPVLNSPKLASGINTPEDFYTPEQADHLNAFVASIVAGTSTDTGSFTRTANLLPEHMKAPVQDRPNFLPEGLCKWLMGLTGNKINKKWLREEISYDITEKKSANFAESARYMMLKYSVDGSIVDKNLSLGIIQVDYNHMNDVWQAALEVEPETTLLDVQNAFKYSEAVSTFNSNPELTGNNANGKSNPNDLHNLAKQDYEGVYDKDRIAVLICQDKKEGELDEKFNIATQNGLRLSFRSQDGSIHSELLASMFGGGGHGGAAGGRVDLPGIELDSKLGVAIDGKIVKDPSVIYEELKMNYDIVHVSIPKQNQQNLCKKIEVVMDPDGKTCQELIKDVVGEIRKRQPKEVKQETGKKETQQEPGKKDDKIVDFSRRSKKKKFRKK